MLPEIDMCKGDSKGYSVPGKGVENHMKYTMNLRICCFFICLLKIVHIPEPVLSWRKGLNVHEAPGTR